MRAEQKRYFDIKVEVKSALPVYEQIKRAIKIAILSGRLEEGDQLMSIRELALKLQINPNTIIKVYYQLEIEGFVASRPGAGYFVKLDSKKLQKERRELFEKATDEYISKITDMGYSLEDIIQEINLRKKETS
ncbi:MAG: GntR family transcriptional regulator [Candidatus Aminicenantes bacterium]|nr:GntR family transcriptional regulator [Candidatus Aminicenantes bacterium]MDH5705091.1 GntR family transcriptional regulator [Candidatus Aminicenantes bacterium]